jgi:large subunit ribosomal protein L3
MGSVRVTTRNLEVIQVDKERNLVILKGSVPGAVNGLVMVRLAGKGRKES